ncbi:TPA: hypothetical protein OB786_003695 [Escherichia fergusonii]|uniref:hypothetical protein n=1 Tax=Escherichia fergusonii TaxID=564 RepID=UPI001777ABEA|nr:hypothetical protein [Escherichia fergusonii]HAI1304039.1 hypothetical protein [Escherichia fergusonii]HCO8235606.1 hypothetical protein [Escherichia fergusonii]
MPSALAVLLNGPNINNKKVHKHSAVAVKNQQLVGAAQQSKLAALAKKTSLFYGELANH